MPTPTPFDAVLLLGFGGPEGPDDVLPFLRNVTRGRGVPDARLAVVAEQYQRFGGVSPINEQNRALAAALEDELADRGRTATTGDRLQVVLGNRNWDPYVEDVMQGLRDRGARQVLAIATSAYSGYSSCRQYNEDIDRARAAVGADAPAVVRVRPYWNHPGFIDAMTARVRDAIDAARGPSVVLFTAHSIPVVMAETSDYEAQLLDAAALVMARIGDHLPWELVFQSRSGPPQVPWLEPDVADRIAAMESGTEAVVAPIGFVSDHMEVLYDLDVLAAEAADAAGVTLHRASTVGLASTFVSGLVDLLDEHLVGAAPVAIGPLGVRPPCTATCCPPPVRPQRPA